MTAAHSGTNVTPTEADGWHRSAGAGGSRSCAGLSRASVSTQNKKRLARAALAYLAEPGDPALGALLELCEPAEVLAAVKVGKLPSTATVYDQTSAQRTALGRALSRWRLRLPDLPDDETISGVGRSGVRLVCPDDLEWPSQLDDLGLARPYAIWLRGSADLVAACSQSVAVVGSRAASAYGEHVAKQIAAELADRGWTIVSGGAYGIDAAAHRGVLAVRGITIAVLASGVDHPYPAGHADLFTAIGDDGLVISEWPPGSHPTRLRFLVRNRVIAALTRGTVVVEAGDRSGALNTARHAAELGRPLMAVPGPVTAVQSAGCHRIIRDWGGVLVTSATDVMDLLRPLSGAASPEQQPLAAAAFASPPQACGAGSSAAPVSRDDLDPDSVRILDAIPARAGIGTSTIARKAGVELDTVMQSLGLLAGCGFIERCEQGWRLTRKAR